MSFNKKVVLVTGASSGIGAATAILFAKEGADVAIVARSQKNLNTVAKKIEALGKEALVISADLSIKEEAATVVPNTVKRFGKLDVLVNNAGVNVAGSILDGNALTSYDKVMQLNVRAVMQLTVASAPHLIKSKGNIVNVSSAAGKTLPFLPVTTAYVVSKAALDHFTRCAALELAPHGVRVNGINPGPVDNNFSLNNNFVIFDKETRVGITALGFMATNEEIGELVLFLASDKAKSVTGSNYVMDNGYLLKH